MPPRKRTTAVTVKATPTVVVGARKTTRTITIDTTLDAAEAIAKRAGMELNQVPHTFEAERIAGPHDTNVRWRFNLPGQMLVVAEDDLPLIEDLATALRAERRAAERRAEVRAIGEQIVEQDQELLDRLAQS